MLCRIMLAWFGHASLTFFFLCYIFFSFSFFSRALQTKNLNSTWFGLLHGFVLWLFCIANFSFKVFQICLLCLYFYVLKKLPSQKDNRIGIQRFGSQITDKKIVVFLKFSDIFSGEQTMWRVGRTLAQRLLCQLESGLLSSQSVLQCVYLFLYPVNIVPLRHRLAWQVHLPSIRSVLLGIFSSVSLFNLIVLCAAGINTNQYICSTSSSHGNYVRW